MFSDRCVCVCVLMIICETQKLIRPPKVCRFAIEMLQNIKCVSFSNGWL